MGFLDTLTKFSSSVISSPGALKRQETSEILKTKNILIDILSSHAPNSEAYQSAERGLDNVNRELRSRGMY